MSFELNQIVCTVKLIVMKSIIIFLCLVICGSSLTAQNVFGIAHYSIPEGWKAVQQSPNIVLEQQNKNGKTCRIIISATEEVVIKDESAYQSYRQQKSSTNFSGPTYGRVMRYENPYITAFSSQTNIIKTSKQKSLFYTFSNGSESFYVQYISDEGTCDANFRTFLDMLEIDDATAKVADKNTSKIKSKQGGKPRGRPRKNPA